MVNWRQFTLGSVQTAMFTPDHSAFSGSRAVATIMRQFGDRFDGEMQVLPIPPDAPPEIPRVILKSSDGSQVMNAGPARFDCLWNQSSATPRALQEAVQQCVEVLESYQGERLVRVGRLGLVVQRVCPNQNPTETLIRRFCNEASQHEPFNRSAGFEIHNHKEYKPAYVGVNYAINSWVRCQAGVVEPQGNRAIVVVQDLNTLASESAHRQFDADEIRAFFLMASEEADAVIKKYFPE